VGHRLGVGVFGDFGIFLAIGDVWAKTAIEVLDAIAKVGNVFLGFGFEFFGVELKSSLKCDVVRVILLEADVERFRGLCLGTNLDEWAKAANIGAYIDTVWGLTDQSWQLKGFESLLECDSFNFRTFW
jgi:hypothetical protein